MYVWCVGESSFKELKALWITGSGTVCIDLFTVPEDTRNELRRKKSKKRVTLNSKPAILLYACTPQIWPPTNAVNSFDDSLYFFLGHWRVDDNRFLSFCSTPVDPLLRKYLWTLSWRLFLEILRIVICYETSRLTLSYKRKMSHLKWQIKKDWQ